VCGLPRTGRGRLYPGVLPSQCGFGRCVLLRLDSSPNLLKRCGSAALQYPTRCPPTAPWGGKLCQNSMKFWEIRVMAGSST
jgi:hypothetical protein